MTKLLVNFKNIKGEIRPLHSVGQPPWLGMKGQFLHYLTEANIPYSRLHDMGGMFGGGIYVDIPNLFRDFDADPENPDSYDFTYSDHLITKLIESKTEPYFRLGVTIENYPDIKRWRILPPKDYNKWAKVCEMIVRHYNEGWANGFNYNIKYWEIWNEPDDGYFNKEKSMMWYGTAEQYYELYEVSAKHLKNCFGDKIKVGGYASCGFYHVLSDPEKFGLKGEKSHDPVHESDQHKGFMTFFYGFLEHIKKTNSPMDFYSWHSYAGVEAVVTEQQFCERILAEYGYSDVEIHINEWNNAPSLELRGSSFASAGAAAMMIALHNTSKVDIMCYYDARIGPSQYGGLFNPLDHKPLCTYYSFKAFGELYALGNCAESECDGVYSLAATDSNGKNAVLMANTSDDVEIESELESFTAYLVDKEHHFTEIPFDGKKISLKKNQVVLIKNY